MNRVCVLAPHTDDGEVGCGGTIARFVEEGAAVHYVAFSAAKILEIEVGRAIRILGIPPERLHIFNFPVREFPRHRQEILQTLIELRRQIKPDLVLLPSSTDIHQDHQVIASEGARAFKFHTVLGYEEPWNNIKFAPRCFIPLAPRHIDLKIAALRAYESQRHRSYLDADFIRGLARTRGIQIEYRYAESFEVLRWVVSAPKLNFT